MSLKKQAGLGAIWKAFGNGSSQLINFVVFIVLTRLISVEDFGLVSFSLLIIEFMQMFLAVGISQNLIRRDTWDHDFSSSTHVFLVLVSLLLTLFTALVIAPVVYFYYSQTGCWIVLLLSIIPAIEGSRISHKAKLQRDFKNKELALMEMACIVVGSLVAIALAFQGFGVWSIAIGRIIQALLSIVLVLYLSDFRPSYTIKKEHVDDIISFGMPIMGMALIGFFSNKVIVIISGIVLGPSIFAFITVANRGFLSLTSLCLRPLNGLVLATISRIEDKKIKDVYYRLVGLTAFIVTPLYLGLGAVAEPFVLTFMGEKWSDSIILMVLTALSAPTIALTWHLSTLLISKGHTNQALHLQVAALSLNVLLLSLTIYWGIKAVVAASVVASYLAVPIQYQIARKYLNFSLLKAISKALPFVVCSLIMYAVLLVLNHRELAIFELPLIKLCLQVITGIIVYFFALFTLFNRNLMTIIQEVKSFRH